MESLNKIFVDPVIRKKMSLVKVETNNENTIIKIESHLTLKNILVSCSKRINWMK